MNFELYTDVILTNDVPEENLRAGDVDATSRSRYSDKWRDAASVGTVVERHNVEGVGTGYSVEFFDRLGDTVAVVTVPASALRAPTHADRLAVPSEQVAA